MENPANPNQTPKNTSFIYWIVIVILVAITAVLATLLLTQNNKNTTNSSNSSTSSSPSSSKSSSQSSTPTSSTLSSSTTSSSSSSTSAPVLTKYTDASFTNFKLSYPKASWSLEVRDDSSADITARKLTLTHTSTGSKLTIDLDNAGHGIGGYCLNSDAYVPITSGWTRFRTEPNIRYFTKTSLVNTTPPLVSPNMGEGDCPAGSSATTSSYIDIPDTALPQAHIDSIKLTLSGGSTDVTLADSIVTSIEF